MLVIIHKAIEFATVCHANQRRKGTDIPYILHCLEAGTLATNLTNRAGVIQENLVAAAILHDTIEDAFISYESLKEIFNEEIAHLVNIQSEDKSKTWLERKTATIDFLKENTSRKVEVVFLADKLSNMRAISRDFEAEKEELWDKFNAGKDLQHWYYASIAEAFSQVTASAEYVEYKSLIDKVFRSE